MKIIAIGAVTAGGKTTAVRAVRALLPNAAALYFDDYTFAGEVTDYKTWLAEGADVHVWDISPLKADIDAIRRSGKCDYLLLDYPFGYQHKTLRDEIDCCIFLDTPLDIALARRVLRDMQEASGAEIRTDMESYLQFAREAFVQMQQSRLADADFVIDGEKPPAKIADEAAEIIRRGAHIL